MRIEEIKLAEVKESPFNPRVTLEKGSKEYEAIADSIREYGFVEPLVVNGCNMRCIGGHQRMSVLKDMGVESAPCVIVDEPDEAREKALCVALNRIKGDWDEEKLSELLKDAEVMEFPTGFDDGEAWLNQMLDTDEPELPEDGAEGGGEPEEEQERDIMDGTTLIKIGSVHFKVTIAEYEELINSVRDNGIFDAKEIAEELKRRLMND